MSKSDARVSAKHSGAISDDASNSEEDEDNRLALEEEQARFFSIFFQFLFRFSLKVYFFIPFKSSSHSLIQTVYQGN